MVIFAWIARCLRPLPEVDEIRQQGKQPLPTQPYGSPSTMAAIIQPQPQPSTSSRDLTLSHPQVASPSPARAVGSWPCAPLIHTSAKTTCPGPHDYVSAKANDATPRPNHEPPQTIDEAYFGSRLASIIFPPTQYDRKSGSSKASFNPTGSFMHIE
ncbi:hypothetical protein TESG_07298 [Trichophyton tonsurans CBS 112818]|uniref:Uncharacterized protein n=1 Tax=Trichophyton tonsurans (strain CBS 112818) TaxID=647933 RepID=F2S8S1_TRIT1|nr:hypothetical protein TESG_07298 [Trichophyton tonsurans CBS 112818]